MKCHVYLLLILTIAPTLFFAQNNAQTKADSIENAANNNTASVDDYIFLSKHYQNISKDKSKKYLFNGLAIAKTNQQKINLYYNFAIINYLQGQIDSAQIYLQKSVNLLTKNTISNFDADIYRAFANCKIQKADFDSAQVLCQKAIDISANKNDSIALMKAKVSMATILNKKLEHEKAYQYLNEADALAKSIADTLNLAIILFEKGMLNQKWKNNNEALNNYEEATVYFEALNNKLAVASVNATKVEVYCLLNRYPEAIELLKQSAQFFRQNNIPGHLSKTLRNLCAVYIKLNEYNLAIEALTESQNILEKNNDNASLIMTNKYFGSIYYELKQYKKSSVYYKKAINLATDINKYNFPIIWLGAVKTFIANNENQLAIETLNQYQHISDSAFSLQTANKIVEMETKYRTLEKENEIQRLNNEKTQQELKLQAERKNRQLISIISLLIIIAGFATFIIYRLRQNQKQAKMAQNKAEIENRLLRAQMNPHFMFNSLNSVQSYIAANKNDLAEEYLARFAMLTRMILNNSRHDYVPLADEHEILDNYLNLEKQRFNNMFNFSITIDQSIDPEQVNIPPMIIQPFVENAILHGIAPKKTDGNISITFMPGQNNKTIICQITDNGIGRQASAQINKGSKHKSMGMAVTTERLQLIKQQTGINVDINIIDMIDNNNQPCGTNVIINLPVVYFN